MKRGVVVAGAVLAATATAFGLLWWLSAPPPGARGVATYVLPREAGDRIQDAAVPFVLESEVRSGWTWTGLSIDRSFADLILTGPGGTTELRLVHPESGTCPDDALRGRVSCLFVTKGEGAGRDAVEDLARSLQSGLENASGELWNTTGAAEPEAVDQRAFGKVVVTGYQTLWLLLIGAACWLLVGYLRVVGWRELSGLGLVFAAALGLRIWFATWGPGDLWMNLASAYSYPGIDVRFGTAAPALFRLLFHVCPEEHGTLVVTNLFLGALAPGLAFVLASALGEKKLAAWATGALLTVHPILVRTGGAAGRAPLVLVLSLALLLAIVRWSQSERGAKGHLLVLLTAVPLCLGTRPEAALVGIPAVFFLVLAWRRSPRGAWAKLGVLGFLAAALGLDQFVRGVLGDGGAVAGGLRSALSGIDGASLGRVLQMSVVGNPVFVSVGAIALTLLGLGVGLRRRRRTVAWTSLSLLFCYPILWWLLLAFTPLPVGVEPHIASTRYQMPMILLSALLGGLGVEALVSAAGERLGRFAAAALLVVLAGVVAATTVEPMRRVVEPRTADLEWAFINDQGPKLPDGARIWQLEVGADLALQGLDFLGPCFGAGREWRTWRGGEVPNDGPRIYYHGSGCSSADLPPEMARHCVDNLRRYGANPLAKARLPNRPTGPEKHLGDEIEVGFYRMDRP